MWLSSKDVVDKRVFYWMSKFKKIVNFKKWIGIERYTQFTTATLIMKNVPKQDEQVNSLHIWDYKLKSSSRVIIHTTKINSKAFAIPILTASGLYD